MTTLFLMRHAKAEKATGDMDDGSRRLSAVGERQASGCGAGLLELDEIPAAFASSPLVRARETAMLVSESVGTKREVIETAALLPGFDPSAAAEWLAEVEADSILLVSHAPSIAQFASWLIAGDGRVELHFRTGSIMRLTIDGAVEPGAAEVEWFLTSDQLVRIAD